MEWYIILVLVVLALLFIVILLFSKVFRQKVYDFVCEAETKITGSKKGQERYNKVVSDIRAFLPQPLHWIFTEALIKKIIEGAVKKMKSVYEKTLE